LDQQVAKLLDPLVESIQPGNQLGMIQVGHSQYSAHSDGIHNDQELCREDRFSQGRGQPRPRAGLIECRGGGTPIRLPDRFLAAGIPRWPATRGVPFGCRAARSSAAWGLRGSLTSRCLASIPESALGSRMR
jgi:hypothetical protein